MATDAGGGAQEKVEALDNIRSVCQSEWVRVRESICR
jgi:hypothetical protein